MQEVRAAVIGTGVMGRKYSQMIAEGKAGALRLTAVVCRSAGAQQWAKDTLPDTVRVCPNADQLYDYAEEFDAVLVVTPHKTHPALVMQFADKDKYEFMLLDSYGGVIASSSGTDAEGIVSSKDFEQALNGPDGLGVANFRYEDGIFYASVMLKFDSKISHGNP